MYSRRNCAIIPFSLADRKIKCSVDNARLKFYSSFNAIYARSKGANLRWSHYSCLNHSV